MGLTGFNRARNMQAALEAVQANTAKEEAVSPLPKKEEDKTAETVKEAVVETKQEEVKVEETITEPAPAKKHAGKKKVAANDNQSTEGL